MSEQDGYEDDDGEISGEIIVYYGDEEWLAWAGDVKSAAYQAWLEKMKRMGRMQ